MVGAVGRAASTPAGVKVYCRRLVRRRDVVEPRRCRSRSAPAATAATRSGSSSHVVPVHPARLRRRRRRSWSRGCEPRRLPRGELRAEARRRVPAGDLPVGQLRPVAPGTAGASAATPPTSTTRWTTSRTSTATTSSGCATGEPGARLRPGAVGGHDRARSTRPRSFAGLLARQGHPSRARPVGSRRAARLAVVARAARPPSAALLLTGGHVSERHLIGLLLGTEEDWPRRVRDARRAAGSDHRRVGPTHSVSTPSGSRSSRSTCATGRATSW